MIDQINNQIPAELPIELPVEIPQARQNKISQIWGDFMDFVKNPNKITWSSGVVVIVVSMLGFFIYHLQKN